MRWQAVDFAPVSKVRGVRQIEGEHVRCMDGYCREFRLSVARCAHYDFRKNFLELRSEVYRRNTVCKHRPKENPRYMSLPRNNPPALPE